MTSSEGALQTCVGLADPRQKMFIGGKFPKAENEELKFFLMHNLNVFAWQDEGIEDIEQDVIMTYILNKRRDANVKRQERSPISTEKKVVEREIDRLLKIGFVRPVQFSARPDNRVVVPMKEKCRVCRLHQLKPSLPK